MLSCIGLAEQHNEQLSLFDNCAHPPCLTLLLLRDLMSRGYPTDIDSFAAAVTTYILNSPDGQASTKKEAVQKITSFLKWCQQSGIHDIQLVGRAEVESFIHWPTGKGPLLRAPAGPTKRSRRTYIRLAYKVARALGYDIADPTLDVSIEPQQSPMAGPCSPSEIEQLREASPLLFAQAIPATLLALVEAGATNGEVLRAQRQDVDLGTGTVRLNGDARLDQRINHLTDWGIGVLQHRLALTICSDVLVTNVYGQSCSEATISQMFRQIVVAADLSVNKLSINSIRSWRAREVFAASGHIEDAARFLGVRSLDTAALTVGFNWAGAE